MNKKNTSVVRPRAKTTMPATIAPVKQPPTSKAPKKGISWIWWTIPVSLLGFGAYLMFRKTDEAPIDDTETHNDKIVTSTAPAGDSSYTTVEAVFPLKNGDYNSSLVGKLQKALNTVLESRYGFMERLKNIEILDVDNDFGTDTEGALKAVTGLTTIDKATYTSLVANPYGWATDNYVRLNYSKAL